MENNNYRPLLFRCSSCGTYFNTYEEDYIHEREGDYVRCPICGIFINASWGKKEEQR